MARSTARKRKQRRQVSVTALSRARARRFTHANDSPVVGGGGGCAGVDIRSIGRADVYVMYENICASVCVLRVCAGRQGKGAWRCVQSICHFVLTGVVGEDGDDAVLDEAACGVAAIVQKRLQG